MSNEFQADWLVTMAKAMSETGKVSGASIGL